MTGRLRFQETFAEPECIQSAETCAPSVIITAVTQQENCFCDRFKDHVRGMDAICQINLHVRQAYDQFVGGQRQETFKWADVTSRRY